MIEIIAKEKQMIYSYTVNNLVTAGLCDERICKERVY